MTSKHTLKSIDSTVISRFIDRPDQLSKFLPFSQGDSHKKRPTTTSLNLNPKIISNITIGSRKLTQDKNKNKSNTSLRLDTEEIENENENVNENKLLVYSESGILGLLVDGKKVM